MRRAACNRQGRAWRATLRNELRGELLFLAWAALPNDQVLQRTLAHIDPMQPLCSHATARLPAQTPDAGYMDRRFFDSHWMNHGTATRRRDSADCLAPTSTRTDRVHRWSPRCRGCRGRPPMLSCRADAHRGTGRGCPREPPLMPNSESPSLLPRSAPPAVGVEGGGE